MALIKRVVEQRNCDERQTARDRESLLRQLDSLKNHERRLAARDLADCADVSEALCLRLAIEPDSAVRSVLFSSLMQIGDSRAISGLVALLRSEDAELRNGSVAALKSLPDQIGDHIEALLHDDDADVRIFTINILETLPHPNVPMWLLQVIEDESDVNVCAAALDLLAEFGTPDMVPALLALNERFSDTPFIAFTVELTVDRIRAATQIEIPDCTLA